LARRVFFSFHYQDVIDFRVNVVRNHNVTKDHNGGYFDASLWESAKKQGDIAIKRLINSGIDNTTVTAVLIGSQTYNRRWVRYEIMKSIERGNDIFGIHINKILCKNRQIKPIGLNPFDHLGLEISSNGLSAKPIEWNGTQWVYYNDLSSFSIPQQSMDLRNQSRRLSHWFNVVDWVDNDGFNNFSNWVG
jgi:hypothetical protein